MRTLHDRLDAGASAISVDKDTVYVMHNDGTILCIPRSGGEGFRLGVGCAGGNVVGDAGDVYILDVRGKRIVRARKQPVETSAVRLLDTDMSGVGLVDGAYLYFTSTDAIWRIRKEGGDKELVTREDDPELLGMDATQIYFGAGSFFGQRSRAGIVPKLGGPVGWTKIDRVAPGGVRFRRDRFVVLDESHVLSEIDPSTNERHERLRLADLPEYSYLKTRRPFLKIDDEYLYFRAKGLTRVSLAGGSIATIEPPGRMEQSITADRGILWLSRHDDHVELRIWE